MIEAQQRVGLDGIDLNIKKDIYDNPTKLGRRQGCPLPPVLFNIVHKALARGIRQEKKIK